MSSSSRAESDDRALRVRRLSFHVITLETSVEKIFVSWTPDVSVRFVENTAIGRVLLFCAKFLSVSEVWAAI